MVNQMQGYNAAFVSDAMKYLQHTAVVEHKDSITEDVKSSLMIAPFIALPSAFGAKSDYNNAKHITNEILQAGGNVQSAVKLPSTPKLTKRLTNIPNSVSNVFSSAWGNIKSGDAKKLFVDGLKNHEQIAALNELDNAIVDVNSAIAKLSSGKNAADADKAKDVLKNLVAKRKEIQESASVADDVLKEADNLILDAKKVSKTGFFSKIGNTISKPFSNLGLKITEATKNSSVYKAIDNTNIGSKVLSKLGKFGKLAKKGGAVFDLIVEGGMQLFTEVIPAFKNGGFGSGMKQLGKSSVMVAGSTVGWVAGAKAGAALGGAIGSVIPGAGTAVGAAIGAVCGIVGGFLGSSLLSGVAKKITGKSENEKIQEEQAQQEAVLIAQDSASVQQLQSAVAMQIQEDMADGELSEDGQKMLEYLNSMPSTGTSTTSFGSLTTTTTNPYSTGLIATNADGSYDFSVPQDVLSQMGYGQMYQTTTNPYGLYM